MTAVMSGLDIDQRELALLPSGEKEENELGERMPSRNIWWMNAHGQSGLVRKLSNIGDLLELVGSYEAWAFLVMSDPATRRIAQCCGDAVSGLAVEVGGPNGASLVVSTSRQDGAESLLSCGEWTYWVRSAALYGKEDAARILQLWLLRGALPPHTQLVSTLSGGGWADDRQSRCSI